MSVTIRGPGDISPAAHDRKEAYDRRNARNNPRRVYVGRYYVGNAPTTEQAAALNDETRREFHDRKNQS